MITKDQISGADANLDEIDISMIISLVKGSDIFKDNPLTFSDINIRLEEINGTVKARQVNAALDLIEELGAGEVQLRGGSDAVYYDQHKERQALVNYIIFTLYDNIEGIYLNLGVNSSNFVSGRLELKDVFL